MIPEFTYDGEKVKNAQVGWNWCESAIVVNCNANALDATKCKALPEPTTTTKAAAAATTATTAATTAGSGSGSATSKKPDDCSESGGM